MRILDIFFFNEEQRTNMCVCAKLHNVIVQFRPQWRREFCAYFLSDVII